MESGEEKTTEKEQTFGEKAVGLQFNPSNNDAVARVKKGYADLIDVMHELRSNSTDAEVKRMCSTAITEAQTSQMWAVKALTWK